MVVDNWLCGYVDYVAVGKVSLHEGAIQSKSGPMAHLNTQDKGDRDKYLRHNNTH